MSERAINPDNGWQINADGRYEWAEGGSSGAGMVISETEPTDKVEGMQWLNPTTGLVLFWDGEKWLEMPGGVDGADGVDGVDGLWTDNGDTTISYNAGNVEIGNHSFRPDGGIFSKFDSGDTSDIHFGAIAGVSNGFQIIQSADNKLAYNFTSTGAYSMTIDGDGNVSVAGILKTDKYINVNGNGYIRGEYAGELRIQAGTSKTSFYNNQNNTELMSINNSGRVDITGSLYVNGTPKIGTVDMIKAFSKLRDAVKDEETVESLKESITNCIGGLIEEWESMQSPATQEISDE